jgi:hypothetical protein
MFGKRFWMFITFAGVPVAIGGLIATIVLTIETGEERPDSECSTTMQATTFALKCFTSDDPKVLLGLAPLLIGLAMIGIGIWRWIVASSAERASQPPGESGGLFGAIENLQQKAMDASMSAGGMSAGGTPPPATPAPPPAPPAPPAPGE